MSWVEFLSWVIKNLCWPAKTRNSTFELKLSWAELGENLSWNLKQTKSKNLHKKVELLELIWVYPFWPGKTLTQNSTQKLSQNLSWGFPGFLTPVEPPVRREGNRNHGTTALKQVSNSNSNSNFQISASFWPAQMCNSKLELKSWVGLSAGQSRFLGANSETQLFCRYFITNIALTLIGCALVYFSLYALFYNLNWVIELE